MVLRPKELNGLTRQVETSEVPLDLYLTREAARQDMFEYIEMFYNPKRTPNRAST